MGEQKGENGSIRINIDVSRKGVKYNFCRGGEEEISSDRNINPNTIHGSM
jgi:hypothetical protein